VPGARLASITGMSAPQARDRYVRENYAALAALELASGERDAIDARTGAALARRGLVFEQPARCWHLTSTGRRVLAELDLESSR
jgi:predicted mannosyl-3-phosphoglycerate phosphatase (HAD superfamily)